MLTIHAELEGGIIRDSFVRLLECLVTSGISCITLAEAASRITETPACMLYMGEIPGRAGKVAIQGEQVY